MPANCLLEKLDILWHCESKLSRKYLYMGIYNVRNNDRRHKAIKRLKNAGENTLAYKTIWYYY